MKNQLLLTQDVPNLGRKGDIVRAKPGYVRNFLLPQKKAVVANINTLRLRSRLQEERAQQAAVDLVESQKLAKSIEGKKIQTQVKVDQQGHMYGSVSAYDIVKILAPEGIIIERHHVQLPRPIKETGEHKVTLLLNEGVETHFLLQVVGEGGALPVSEETSSDNEAT